MPRVVVAPTSEPIRTEDAKAHLRVDSDDDDFMIDTMIGAAREWAESFTGRAIARQTLEIALDAFPYPSAADAFWSNCAGLSRYSCWIDLPAGPIVELVSMSYLDSGGLLQAVDLASLVLDQYSMPSRLIAAPGFVWPNTASVPNAVKIRYVAGYSPLSEKPADLPLPNAIKHAMLLVVGHLYENRQSVLATDGRAAAVEVPMGAQALLYPYRVALGV